ncbi:MAG: citrate/2-methylcitrate synthase [Phycisphaerales bacterium]|nr:citrate/2-methylcitrate synthase [Phycisphaerales bacterium]
MGDTTFKPGLVGAVAGETAISSLGPEGLRYRGYAIADLAGNARYEEVLHLMVYGELPSRRQLSILHDTLMEYRRLPRQVTATLRSIPTDAPLMNVLRTTVSLLGHFDPTRGTTIDDARRRAIWITASTASLVAARYRFTKHSEPLDPRPGLTHAAQLFYQLTGKEPDEAGQKLLDLMLVLSAEHGFSTPTFAARVAVSGGQDLLSSMVAAIATLCGAPADAECMQINELLGRFATVQDAQTFVESALEKRESLPGFGHAIYPEGDPRAVILEAKVRETANVRGMDRLMDIYDAIRDAVSNRRGTLPNLGLPRAIAMQVLGLPVELTTPLFVVSRTAGWCAHIIEQMREGTAYRPTSNYRGELPRQIPPMHLR